MGCLRPAAPYACVHGLSVLDQSLRAISNAFHPGARAMAQNKTALIFGVSGIVGRSLAERLLAVGDWNVIGVARRNHSDISGIEVIACDLTDPTGARRSLAAAAAVTHLFFCTWSRQATEKENCAVNGSMLRTALECATANAKIRHAALVTGLKHYLGPFENYGKQELDTPFSEEQERLPGDNFYYTQEDILFELAAGRNFSWSVARPHTIIGCAPGNDMNLGTSIAVYASLCRETCQPFVFPGSPQAYNGLVDMTDAGLLAEHLEWEATCPHAANKAFNVVNGDCFRWRKMWRRIADYFGLATAPYPGHPTPLVQYLKDAEPQWRTIVHRHGLRNNSLAQLASWWHVDADLGRAQECVTDMNRSRDTGFLSYRNTWHSFRDLFDRLYKEKIIPRP